MAEVKIFENITMKHEKPTHPIFYREFYKNYLEVENDLEAGLVKTPLILSGLFIHLTFESLITYATRIVINTAYKNKEQNIKKIWSSIFETEHLDKKLKFLQNSIVVDNEVNSVKFKKINKFITERLAPLRNKIIHGHEISRTFGTEVGIANSKLLELLSEENIKGIYNEFWENTEIFLSLFNDLIIPDGMTLSSAFIADQINNPKEFMKRIEKEVEGEIKII
jgi:hypothetical protein